MKDFIPESTNNSLYDFRYFEVSEDTPVHMHALAEIIYSPEADAELIIDFERYTLPRGHALFINASVPHAILSGDTPFSCYSVRFLPEAIYCYERSHIYPGGFLWFCRKRDNVFLALGAEETKKAQALMEDMHKLSVSPEQDHGHKLFCKVLLLWDLFFGCYSKYASGEDNYTFEELAMVKGVLDRIEKSRSISITEGITRIFSDSDSSIQIFREICGCSIEEYSRMYRTRLVVTLCLGNENPELFGFETREAFENELKSSYGKSIYKMIALTKSTSSVPISATGEYDYSYKRSKSLTNESHRPITAKAESSITRAWAVHRFFKMIFVNKGEGMLESGYRTTILKEGEMVFLYPYERYRFMEFTRDVDVVLFTFFPMVLSEGKTENPLVEELFKIPREERLNISIAQSPVIVACLDALNQHKDRLPHMSDAFLKALCLETVRHLVREHRHGLTADDRNPVNRIIRYVDRHYTQNLKLGKLCTQFGVSYSHTSRKFKEITGKSFNDYINETRLNRAGYLLSSTDNSIRKIAAVLGYCRRSHFTKLYTKHYGITPMEARQMAKEK